MGLRFADGLELLQPCIASINERSEYPQDKIEIIVVDNGSIDEETLGYLASLSARAEQGLSEMPESSIFQA